MTREKKDFYDIIKIIDESKIADSFKEIINHIQYLEDRNESLRKQLSEYNKDSEIQKLNEEIEDIKNSVLSYWSEVEKKRSRKFQEEHREKCGRSNVSYIITETGIGTVIKIICNSCKEESDITDINKW